MPFNSLNYILFLPLVYLVFCIAGVRARCFVLLAASMLFYAALMVPYLLVVLVLVAMTTFAFGNWLNQADNPKVKHTLLFSGIAANVFILVVMKYLPFLSENLNIILNLILSDANIKPIQAFVAIGVSYYVFQAISYLIDIYLEIEKPEQHFGYFFLYLAFFPKLLQGPIERSGDLIPQLKAKYEFNYDNVRFGMLLFIWGLFKKVVIADRLGILVDTVYNDVRAFSGLPLLLASYAYAFQVYMDFSGYTDMALGSARLFNINLTQNFNSPYLATSVADFWRRWHITFSRWILDYIFKPLQMHWRNWKNWGTATALIVTFFVSGIWHGASWGYVFWGLLHGIYLAASNFYKPYQKMLRKRIGLEKSKWLKVWQIFVTFNLVCFAWIFFRAGTIHDAFYLIKNMFISNGYSMKKYLSMLKTYDIVIILILMPIIIYIHKRGDNLILEKRILNQPVWLRWSIYLSILIFIIVFRIDSSTTFLYFQF